MSLQLAAQHLASRGRGPDTTLVHMAPQEVAGLQALAKAHGGTLTINPDTGLAEAGFLSSILPTLVGAGLSMIPGVGPLMAAGIVGGGTALATGSLQKGLMAGLGAYGGAGIAGGLAGAGATAGLGAAAGEAAAAGELAAAKALAESQAANAAMAGTETAANAAASATPEFAALNATPNQFGAFGEAAGSYASPIQAANMVPTVTAAPVASGMGNISVEEMLKAGFTPEQIAESAQEYAANTAGNAGSPFTAGTNAALDNPMKAGLGEVMKRPGDFMTKDNLKYGLAALAPVGMEMMTPKPMAEPEKRKAFEYSYAPGRDEDPQAGYTGAYTGERTYFNPVYTRTAADGGLMGAGPIEAMSDRNQTETMMANGGMRYAEGGETKAVRPVEEDPYYDMSGQSGDAFRYLMGQGARPATPVPTPVAAAPVQSTVQAAPQNMSPMARFFGALTGKMPVDKSARPYTFNPATGTFTTMAQGGIASLAQGGPSHLGDYSDGGRLLRGPGDGVSDSIPASIGDKRPARLADGEFVVPARIVSELGNGSTEAGARKLYAMMDRVQQARGKTTGKNRVAVNTKAEKMLPA